MKSRRRLSTPGLILATLGLAVWALLLPARRAGGVITPTAPPTGTTVAAVVSATVSYPSNLLTYTIAFGNLDAKGDFVRAWTVPGLVVIVNLATGKITSSNPAISATPVAGVNLQVLEQAVKTIRNGLEIGTVELGVVQGSEKNWQ